MRPSACDFFDVLGCKEREICMDFDGDVDMTQSRKEAQVDLMGDSVDLEIVQSATKEKSEFVSVYMV